MLWKHVTSMLHCSVGHECIERNAGIVCIFYRLIDCGRRFALLKPWNILFIAFHFHLRLLKNAYDGYIHIPRLYYICTLARIPYNYISTYHNLAVKLVGLAKALYRHELLRDGIHQPSNCHHRHQAVNALGKTNAAIFLSLALRRQWPADNLRGEW